MRSTDTLRVIIDGSRDGAMNMAVDQALLEGGRGGRPSAHPAVLYVERSHCLPRVFPEGYGDRQAERSGTVNALCPQAHGGGAILHDDEITYSLTLPFAAFSEPVGIEEMYRLVHDAFIGVLDGMGIQADYRGGKDPEHSTGGPFFCFARTYRLDLTLGGDKLLGSAQRRLKAAAMQHGSFILGRTHTEQPSAACRDHVSGMFDRKGFLLDVAAGVAGQLDVKVVESEFSREELDAAALLRKDYASDRWNRKR